MKKVITGYGSEEAIGADGGELMNEMVESVKENLGANVEVEGVASNCSLFKVTIIVEKLVV